jgi:hypothetical protein
MKIIWEIQCQNEYSEKTVCISDLLSVMINIDIFLNNLEKEGKWKDVNFLRRLDVVLLP